MGFAIRLRAGTLIFQRQWPGGRAHQVAVLLRVWKLRFTCGHTGREGWWSGWEGGEWLASCWLVPPREGQQAVLKEQWVPFGELGSVEGAGLAPSLPAPLVKSLKAAALRSARDHPGREVLGRVCGQTQGGPQREPAPCR